MEAMEHMMQNHTEAKYTSLGLPERFGGHIVPASFAFLVGLRWMYCALERFTLLRREATMKASNGRKFQSSYMYPSSYMKGLPLEAVVTMVFLLIILTVEGQNAFGHHGHRLFMNFMHLISYILLGIPPIIVILRHYRYPVVPGLEYLMSAMGFLLFGLLMYQHTLDQNSLNRQAHVHLVMLLSALSIILIFEALNMDKPVFPVLRGFMYCFVGSFVAQMDFILYPLHGDPWPNEDHLYLFLEAITLVFHFVGSLVVMGVLSFIAMIVVKRLPSSQVSRKLDFSLGKSTNDKYLDEAEEGKHCLLNCCDDIK